MSDEIAIGGIPDEDRARPAQGPPGRRWGCALYFLDVEADRLASAWRRGPH